MSKEIQLSLSFCGALAALLFISAPVSETASLVGSGSAFLVAGGFFYVGISKCFSDKAKQLADAERHAELLYETFKIGDEQLQAIVAVTNKLNNQLAQRDEKLDSRFNDVINAVENLEDSLKPLSLMSETLKTINNTVGKLNVVAGTIEYNSGKLNDLLKATQDVADNLEDVAENVEKISLIKEGLQELANVLKRQEEFYNTTLNQYKSISGKDVELIETLAQKLR